VLTLESGGGKFQVRGEVKEAETNEGSEKGISLRLENLRKRKCLKEEKENKEEEEEKEKFVI